MGKYIAKRIGYMALVFLIVSFLMYSLYNLIPTDPARAELEAQKQSLKPAEYEQLYQELRAKMGLDDPLVIRYMRWMGLWPDVGDNSDFNGLLQGNFGYSYQYKKDVVNVVAAPMKNTIFINIFATILALAITIPLGIACAVRKNSKFDRFTQVFTIIGYSLPSFIICILFIWVFCALLGWFPASGMKTPGSSYEGFKWFTDRMYYLALPLITMTFCSLGSMTRYVRASMIDALSMDCIRTARAKGVKEKTVIYSHAWRNALIPIVTMIVGWFTSIFAGSLIFEDMFGLNGMGKLMISSLRTSDYDVTILMQLFYVVVALLGNLVIDIVYGLVDPRVRVNK